MSLGYTIRYMPSCSKARNPHGIEITFEESTHKYTSIINGNEIDYISGTTFISKFFRKFDPTGEITEKYAKKHGLTVESVKKQWREKADRSCIYGTKIHETCEDTLLGRELRNKPKDLKEELSMKNAVEIAKKVLSRSDLIGVEKIIFDEDIKIAGTIDLLIRAKKDNRIWICDWKTNEKLEFENKFRNFGLNPIENVPDTNVGHYQLQLSLYEYILKKVGYIDKNAEVGRCLFHITEKGVKSYPLESRLPEIEKMIEYYTEGKIK